MKYKGTINDPKDLVTKEWVEANGGSITDVQVNGTTIVSDKVANVPIASVSGLGVVKPDGTTITIDGNGVISAEGQVTAKAKNCYVGAITGDGTTTQFTFSHGLNTRDIVAEIYDQATYESALAEVTRPTTDTVVVEFVTAPAVGTIYRVLLVSAVIDYGHTTTAVCSLTGDGSTTVFQLNHGLNSRDIMFQVYDGDTYDSIEAEISRPTVSVVKVEFTTAPAQDKVYRVMCIGLDPTDITSAEGVAY